jgi:hypothetical protein
MEDIVNTALVRRPIAAVFDLATTGGYWPRWHPATRSVTGAIDHPVQRGECITERVRIAGLPGTATWTCVERAAPRRLVLDATSRQGVTARIVYTFIERPGGTLFSRTLTYHLPGPLGAVVERLLMARVMRKQSAVAMANLKALIEATVPPG